MHYRDYLMEPPAWRRVAPGASWSTPAL